MFPGPEDIALFEDMQHYFKYALGAYGWPLFLWHYPCLGLCDLCRACGICCSSSPAVIEKDNSCLCHTAALLRHTGLHRTEVLLASYHNELYRLPFFVAFDHEKRTMVITVRGTLSSKDCLTDALVKSTTMCLPDGTTAVVHSGFYHSAHFILDKLKQNNILDHPLLCPDSTQGLPYQLRIIGHSLGAGAASLLAIILYPEFPSLQCYAFSAPGATICETGARFTEQFVTSMVVGWDMVARMHMQALMNFKKEMLLALYSTDQPKVKILGMCCINPFAVRPWWQHLATTEANRAFEQSVPTGARWSRMFPAGRIIHLAKVSSRKRFLHGRQRLYLPVWRSRYYFDKVCIFC